MPDNLTSENLVGLLADDRILLVGGGKMGMALLDGWLAAGLSPQQFAVQEPHPSDALKATGVSLSPDDSFAPSLTVLAIKPQMVGDVLPQLTLPDGSLVVSLMAGVAVDSIKTLLGKSGDVTVKCIRTMPNTPASIGKGITALFAETAVESGERDKAAALLAAVGETVWLDNEAMIDAVTAISGSGPAYVFYLAEAMSAAGQVLGMKEDMAQKLAMQTIIGAAAMLDNPQADASELRRNVTSPGGTTQAALDVLMAEDGMSGLMRRATQNAAERARELAQLAADKSD